VCLEGVCPRGTRTIGVPQEGKGFQHSGAGKQPDQPRRPRAHPQCRDRAVTDIGSAQNLTGDPSQQRLVTGAWVKDGDQLGLDTPYMLQRGLSCKFTSLISELLAISKNRGPFTSHIYGTTCVALSDAGNLTVGTNLPVRLEQQRALPYPAELKAQLSSTMKTPIARQEKSNSHRPS